jgi:hypothetical protein
MGTMSASAKLSTRGMHVTTPAREGRGHNSRRGAPLAERRLFKACRLDWAQGQSYDLGQEETIMHAALRAVLAMAIVATLASRAIAQSGATVDPDWPCHQIKTPTYPLATVWSGPELDLNSQSWRDESDVADLAAKMAQRRIPVADVVSAIADFKAKAGADADAKLLRAFAAGFRDLSQQRSKVIDGLERFGRKQRVMADRIRTENEAVQKSADQRPGAQTAPVADSGEQLQWDIRIFDDQRQMVTYVCEVPTLIEQRIGTIARAVEKAL